MPEMDTAHSAMISAHAFCASVWWERCAVCGFSMAAHTDVVASVQTERASSLGALDHRCPACVLLDQDKVDRNGVTYRIFTDCPHRWED